MAVKNICFLLNNFIKCSAYENIVFCWVMHEQSIIDDIVSRLDTGDCKIHIVVKGLRHLIASLLID